MAAVPALLASTAYSYSGWCPTPRPEACPGLRSPYRRPAILQPARIASDLGYLRLTAYLESAGTRMPTLGVDVAVRACGDKGKGLFALRTFAPDEVVARYSGVRATYSEFKAAWEAGLTSGDYLAPSYTSGEGSEVRYVDATDASASAIGRYANHNVRRRNCELCNTDKFLGGVMFLMTTKPVAAGEEFLLDYGREYWDCKLGAWPTPQRLSVDFA